MGTREVLLMYGCWFLLAEEISCSSSPQLWEADIGSDEGMYNEDLYQGDIMIKEDDKKSAVSNPALLWPNGIVVFKIADDVGCPDSNQCKILMYAMETYHKQTCIKFKEWTGEDDFVEIFYNSVDSGACWSLVGKSGGRQRLSLGYRCWYLGIVVHELGHALGFWHEMNRPDRDNHIRINWHNILPGFISAFQKNPPSSVNDLNESFDLKSIMMYDEYAFSKDGKSPTIEAISGEEIGPIWRKAGLSQTDLRRVHKLYQCNGSIEKNELSFGLDCNFKAHTCGFRNRGSSAWKWRGFPKSDGYIFIAGNETLTKSELISVNFHSPGDTVQPGCLVIAFYLTSTASLQVKQEVLSKVTDITQEFTRGLWMSASGEGKWRSVRLNLDMKKPYRIVFFPEFSSRGIAALKNIKIKMKPCLPSVSQLSYDY